MPHTLRSLQQDLLNAGITPGDTLLVHSSMKSIGSVDGGADTVIDAFLDFFKDNGLIVFPSLSYTLTHTFNAESERCRKCGHYPKSCLAMEWAGRQPEFHVNTTPACVGLLPNMFMKHPQVCRSLNPTHSLAAAGKDAKDFTAGHELSDTPCGKLTPWWKLYLRNAKILHLGAHLYNTTYLHAVSEWFCLPEKHAGWLENQCLVFDQNEQLVQFPKMRNTCGVSAKFPLLEQQFREAGGLHDATIGDAKSLVLDCRIIADVALQELKKNPSLFD